MCPHARRRNRDGTYQLRWSCDRPKWLSIIEENEMPGGNFLRISTIAAVLLLCSGSARTNEVRHLKLEEAVRLALEQNRTLKMARLKVKENEFRKGEARSDYFPTITNQSNALHISELQNVVIPQGALGNDDILKFADVQRVGLVRDCGEVIGPRFTLPKFIFLDFQACHLERAVLFQSQTNRFLELEMPHFVCPSRTGAE